MWHAAFRIGLLVLCHIIASQKYFTLYLRRRRMVSKCRRRLIYFQNEYFMMTKEGKRGKCQTRCRICLQQQKNAIGRFLSLSQYLSTHSLLHSSFTSRFTFYDFYDHRPPSNKYHLILMPYNACYAWARFIATIKTYAPPANSVKTAPRRGWTLTQRRRRVSLNAIKVKNAKCRRISDVSHVTFSHAVSVVGTGRSIHIPARSRVNRLHVCLIARAY